MSNMLGQTLKSFFFSRDASVNQSRVALFINGNMHEEALLVLCLFSFQRNDGGSRDSGYTIPSSQFPLYCSNMVCLQSMLRWWQTCRHFYQDSLAFLLYLRYTFLASLCCGRQKCWSWLAGRPRQRRLHSEIEENFISRWMHFKFINVSFIIIPRAK